MISLWEVLSSLDKPNWTDRVDLLVGYSTNKQLTASERDYVLERLSEAVAKQSARHATNWLVLGLLLGSQDFLSDLRKSGVLRPSRYDYSTSAARSAVARVLARIELDPEARLYLTSVKNLHTLSEDVSKLNAAIIRQLRVRRESLLKALIAEVDLRFMQRATIGYPTNRLAKGDTIEFYTTESLGEALSYVVFLYHSEIGSPSVNPPFTSADSLVAQEVLIQAARVRYFHEVEVLVDRFAYNLHVTGGVVRLTPPSRELERAIRLGYVGGELQRQIPWQVPAPEVPVSLGETVRDLYQASKEHFVELVDNPVRRYRFKWPLGSPLDGVLGDNALFLEELRFLSFWARDLLTPIENLVLFEATEGITVLDLVKVRRMFEVLRMYAALELIPHLQDDPMLVRSSLVPAFSRSDLLRILRVAIGDKAPRMLEFLTWQPDAARILDLQYQPIIRFAGGFLVPANVFASSDSIRNALQLSRSRLYSDGTFDPVVALLYESLKARTAEVVQNPRWSWNGTQGEVDVLACIDSVFYVFECKNSLVPTSVFELRTSYDYVITAGRQLTNFTTAMEDEGFRQHLRERLGWEIRPDVKVATCIVMSNRMFTGLRLEGHAVRGLYELLKFIDSGIIQIGDEEVRMWQSETFGGDDLERFIVEDIMHALMWEAMEEHVDVIPLGRLQLEVETFAFDLHEFARRMGVEVAE